jgi:hypothetical protein
LEGSGTTPCFNWEATAPFVPETLGTSEILPHDLSTTRLIPNICPEVIRAENDATAPPRTTTSSIRNEKNTEHTGYATLCSPVFQNLSHTTFLLPYNIERIPKKTEEEEQQEREEQEHEQNKSTVNESLFSSPPSQSFYFRHLERKGKKTHTNTTTTTRWNKNQQQRQQILYGFSSSHTAFVLQILFVWLKSLKPGILSPSVRC